MASTLHHLYAGSLAGRRESVASKSSADAMCAGIATVAMIALKPIDEVRLHVSRPLVLPRVRP